MNDERELIKALWRAIGEGTEPMPSVVIEGTAGGLPSVYEVAAFATACVGVASAAASELWAARTGTIARMARVDRTHAAVAFRSERYLTPIGWTLPPVWDPIAGDYETRDGFVRLHTNYAYHRTAALRVLGVTEDREAVARRVRTMNAEDLEHDVVREGGCAAKMRTAAEWAAHPQGIAVASAPLVSWETTRNGPKLSLGGAPERPLAGVRVLDLTRVIAGPVCTRTLAAQGADVLRIDPPEFQEVDALLGDTTGGKRRATLDLHDARDRDKFEQLVGEAHAIVHGFRSDAMQRLGFSTERLRALQPSLAIVTNDAYGFDGPWATRRGFDSLVQMSCGIAARGKERVGGAVPVPMPAQALDHGTGYLLAAATCRALTRGVLHGEAVTAKLSLARTAHVLTSLGDGGDPSARQLTPADAAPYLERTASAFGPLDRVRCPVRIEGSAPQWTREPGPLGVDSASWE